MDEYTTGANRIIKLATLASAQMRDEAGALYENTQAIGRILNRHLADEEEIVVPIILHHKLRG